MEVNAKVLPECKKGKEEQSAATLRTSLKDHNNNFLQKKVDLSFSHGLKTMQDQLMEEPLEDSLQGSEHVVRLQIISTAFCPNIKGPGEVIVAVTTNIESQEFRRCYGQEKGLPPEHLRAGSTDDVEVIFAYFHERLGPLFDEKALHDALKSDPELPFFHYTGVNERSTQSKDFVAIKELYKTLKDHKNSFMQDLVQSSY
ncbi:hypothetical protein ACROYT_G014739 [Oculina patagonica]